MNTCRLIFIAIFSFVAGLSAVQAPSETRGVTEKQLSSVDLGPEIQGLAGRRLRMRLITIDAGGATVIHTHDGRPGTVYILSGKITDHRDGKATEYGPGLGWPEDKSTTHWIENRGTAPAVEISVDIFQPPTSR
jgi:quercetin dioxygenase-like cupin family protein